LTRRFVEQVKFALALHPEIESVYDEEHDSHAVAPPRE
jgi:hypothetical protein